jgi:hypothetical protein
MIRRPLVVLLAVSLVALATFAQAQQSALSLSSGGRTIHVFPTTGLHATLPPATGPLLYNGGPVMQTANTYAIFWVPSQLQNGTPTSMTAHYQTVQKNMLTDYPAHGLDNNNTQYYQINGSTAKYIKNVGKFAGSYVDSNPYPASGCFDNATPAGCITDAQLIAEIQRVMNLKGWTGGLTKMFLMFTSSGEGSCFDSSSTQCAYTYYCAYHGMFNIGSTQVVYSNEPFGNTSTCQIQGAPSPNADPQADAAATAASHELTEAITDPTARDGWFTSAGYEIGDLCAYVYGSNTWDGGLANEMWNGHFYLLQTEWDNHLNGCVQVGP